MPGMAVDVLQLASFRAITVSQNSSCGSSRPFSGIQLAVFKATKVTKDFAKSKLILNSIYYVKLLLEGREISPRKKVRGPASYRNQTQDLLQVLFLPLSHWCPWKRSGKCIIYRPQPKPADFLSLGGDPSSSANPCRHGCGPGWIDCTSGYYPPPQPLQRIFTQRERISWIQLRPI